MRMLIRMSTNRPSSDSLSSPSVPLCDDSIVPSPPSPSRCLSESCSEDDDDEGAAFLPVFDDDVLENNWKCFGWLLDDVDRFELPSLSPAATVINTTNISSSTNSGDKPLQCARTEKTSVSEMEQPSDEDTKPAVAKCEKMKSESEIETTQSPNKRPFTATSSNPAESKSAALKGGRRPRWGALTTIGADYEPVAKRTRHVAYVPFSSARCREFHPTTAHTAPSPRKPAGKRSPNRGVTPSTTPVTVASPIAVFEGTSTRYTKPEEDICRSEVEGNVPVADRSTQPITKPVRCKRPLPKPAIASLPQTSASSADPQRILKPRKFCERCLKHCHFYISKQREPIHIVRNAFECSCMSCHLRDAHLDHQTIAFEDEVKNDVEERWVPLHSTRSGLFGHSDIEYGDEFNVRLM